MVRWYHAILSAYGFWLPNDPRGSWSDFVHAWELFRFAGPATTVTGKRSYARDAHDVQKRRAAKAYLKYPPARFDGSCHRSIGGGFARACDEFRFVVFACAIGHDHAHVVLARDPGRSVEQVVAVLKARATQQMNLDGTHPIPLRADGSRPTPWAKGCWSVFVNDEAQLDNAIAYVERHPMKEGLARQNWHFITRR